MIGGIGPMTEFVIYECDSESHIWIHVAQCVNETIGYLLAVRDIQGEVRLSALHVSATNGMPTCTSDDNGQQWLARHGRSV